MFNRTTFNNGNKDTALRKHLFGCYGGFASRAIKVPAKGRRFFIDDREKHNGIGSGERYGWFCEIAADVESDAEVKVTLEGNLPRSSTVDDRYRSL